MARRQENPILDFIKKRYILIIFAVFVSVVLGLFAARVKALSTQQAVFPKGVAFVKDQIIVKYKDGQSPDELEARGETSQKEKLLSSLSKIGAVSQKKLFEGAQNGLGNYYILYLKEGVGVPETYDALKNIPEVETPSPNYILRIQATPDDPYFPEMWNLKNDNLEKAWSITRSNGVLVGVVDTGVDYNHEDLKGAVVKGRNFISNNDDPMDDQGHGTHVAGTIGAVTNNGIGVSGVSWGARILAVKACDADGNCNTSDVSQGIKYAVDHGAKVVNISIAGPGSCRGTYSDILEYARSKGVLVVSAAGNGQNGTGPGVSADNQIPASCDSILAVGALTNKNKRSTFSNYGNKVRIAAPGGQGPCDIGSCILSTSLNNTYSLRSGTSMASPQISGLAALLLTENPSLPPQEIVSCIVRGGDKIKTDKPIGPKVNTLSALRLCAPREEEPTPTPTDKIKPFSISGTVYQDSNNNKKLDKGELPFEGAQVILSGFSSESVVTNKQGKYSFLDLKPGLYSISTTVNGKSTGDPLDTVLSQAVPAVLLNIFVPGEFSPTPPVQKTASGCYIDPLCLSQKGSFQVCSFQCR